MIPHHKRQSGRARAKAAEVRDSGRAFFSECRRYDGDGNLIEVISPEKQMETNTNTIKGDSRPKNRWGEIMSSYKEIARIKKIVKGEEEEGKYLRPLHPLRAARRY